MQEHQRRAGRIALDPAVFDLAVVEGEPAVQDRRSAHARSLYRWILPVAVFGSSSTNSTQRGYL